MPAGKVGGTAPPSGLPAISPSTRGEIGSFGAAAAFSVDAAAAIAVWSRPWRGKPKPPTASIGPPRTMPMRTPGATSSTRPARRGRPEDSNSPIALTISAPWSSMMMVA
ncbi:hypothetical protein [Mesorhizobium sp.]|uniref:hypothetical protein n=1 Tax=Mesorhizobium sp. TaxID=1871066 RepID=UPI001200A366|nr:hypothetical protein [Mesorhizobium sp.]TIO51300.1 MAG: hypothetical protein E5X78_17500 [Mesorhizobium sp.]